MTLPHPPGSPTPVYYEHPILGATAALHPTLPFPLLHSQGCSTTETPRPNGIPLSSPPPDPAPQDRGVSRAVPQRAHPGSDLPSSVSTDSQSAWTISHQLEELNLNIETRLRWDVITYFALVAPSLAMLEALCSSRGLQSLGSNA